MSPFIKRVVFGCTIVLNTVLFAYNLLEREDIPSAVLNVCVCIISWIGIYFVNAAEQLDKQLGNTTGEYDDDDE